MGRVHHYITVKDKEEYPQLLNLNLMNKECLVINHDRKLELSLGPPGEFSPETMPQIKENLVINSLSKSKENGGKPENPFVKIKMEGIPIGRKVNLNAYGSYEELSFAIDKLFSGLLAAQRDTSATQNGNKIESSLARNGEYTLVYDDDEGDVP
ncbi:auxin-responsive protein IAA26-like [Gossypium australe]|uniref:Auxin-responsive protein n=1 Tax=Gossypium australe TaxID=47621 RepID=A0A5B6XBB4_9ROSI|nr:auxin-responsive protein IAA26-like [Gossypium australe]